MMTSPESLLAEDDALLERRVECLRLWEPEAAFVVLGRSCNPERDVDLEACEVLSIPVLRRSTGGGTVLQAPGCLNFTLILNLETRPELSNVAASYDVILGWIADALALPGLTIAGSDLLSHGRKVSGNAQRRVPGWLLHHGTLLSVIDMALVERVLREPARQPPHRARRRHRDFLGILPLSTAELRTRLGASFPPGFD